MARDYAQEVSELSATLNSVEQVLDIPKLKADFIELEKAASEPNLWDNPEKAQVVTSKLSRVQATINKSTGIRRRLDEVPLLFELAEGEKDILTRVALGAATREELEEIKIDEQYPKIFADSLFKKDPALTQLSR